MNGWIIYGAILIFTFLWCVEMILLATWNQFYFTVGLPIFIRQVQLKAFSFTPLDTGRMESEFKNWHASFMRKSLDFKKFDTNLYAFRERLDPIGIDIMRGILVFDQTQLQVIVKGYANYWVILWVLLNLVIFVWSIVSGELSRSILVGLLLIFPAIKYAFDTNIYSKVAQKAAELAATPHKAD
jgi:hypothetical protein